MLIQIKKVASKVVKDGWYDGSVLVGNISRKPGEPWEEDDKVAARLIKTGAAEAVISMPQSSAQRAVAPKLDAQRR